LPVRAVEPAAQIDQHLFEHGLHAGRQHSMALIERVTRPAGRREPSQSMGSVRNPPSGVA
jgi:hypothetical protein